MDWSKEMEDLYIKVTDQVPEAFRSSVKPMLREASEKTARLRNSGWVEKDDLLSALFEITPEAFQPTVVEDLAKLGIDTERYINLSNIRKEYARSWDEISGAFLPGVYHFTMYLTDRCNQKCIHCAAEVMEKREELTTDQWIHIIENVEQTLRERGRRGCYIWFGGEPTLRKDLKDLIKYCGEKGYYQAISTNGMLFDEELAKLCAEVKMSHVFISYDSTIAERAAKIRGVPKAKEYAEKAINLALKYGHFVICTATVQQENFEELETIQKELESIGVIPYFRAIIKQRTAEKNWKEIGLNYEEYRKFYEFKYENVVDAIRKGEASSLNKFYTYDMVPFMECPINDAERTALEWGVGCQACRSVSGIDINGDFFPCDYPSVITLGNVLEQNFDEVMESEMFKAIRDRKIKGKCSTCHHLDLCGGGCRVHAENETGDFLAPFPFCWHEDDHSHEK
ncbi:MAG: radical SAM protein [Candidatus Lokiarchaeota archaeon]|nr:radical SAM protein [Candidatus Lokiarchaeota archaeon]MBD3201413.1 radical SAM protein [Candidatus Lokiarchaeota archaeon]